MFFTIDPKSELAIYDQVVRQIMFAVAAGVLKPGELVPSVRELARELAINPNTVARAYRRLQDLNVLETVRGTGLAVTERAGAMCRQQRRDLIAARVRQALVEAKQSRLDAGEIQTLVQRQLEATLTDSQDS